MIEGQTREEARARLKPGNFQGRPPRGRSRAAEQAAMEALDDNWFGSSRFKRRARVLANEPLTSTGTFVLRLEAIDDVPFDFAPGQFVGIEAHFEGRGFRRSPYCILSDPSEAPRFDLLVRAVPDGPLSLYLSELEAEDELLFRGPTGRPMAPASPTVNWCCWRRAPAWRPPSHWRATCSAPATRPDLAVLGAPAGRRRLPHLGARRPGRDPPPSPLLRHPVPATGGWTGLRGGLGESVPPLLPTLGGKRYYLVGNGAMLEEMALALSDMGVAQQQIYKGAVLRPDPPTDREVVAQIRERFVANDLFSAYAARRGSHFDIDRDIEAARTGTAGNGDPLAVSDLFELLPAFLSHHPDQEDPAPNHVQRPWTAPTRPRARAATPVGAG